MLKNLKNFSLPELEEQLLAFWKQNQIFEQSLKKNSAGGKKFVFFEGPPTANGMPGIHHIEARAFKDVIPRYKTMRGFNVPRKAGWDTHGLPVELQTEKELGMKNKSEIEKYGIAEFNAKCKELVWRYRSEFEASTERMGFWLDLKNPYVTYENRYIESIWWLLAEINKTGLLKKMLRTVPWCTRCQTPLSSHELGQPGAYRPTKDPSLFVKFELKEAGTSKKKPKTYFLAWTTTPWTLPGNLALAINPKLAYKKFEVKKTDPSAGSGQAGVVEYLYAYNTPAVREGYEVKELETVSGKKLVGKKYVPLYPLKTKHPKLKIADLHKVRAGDFVSTEDGSGIVHIAPSFGEEDFKLMGIKEGLPMTIDDQGKMNKGYPGAGKYIKQADNDIVADLIKRGLLYQQGEIEHEYPHCWRCNSALVYMVRSSWFIEMSKLRDQMLKNNQKINWTPANIKEGRFGEWLKDLKDWSISRNRYWGAPIPIWECADCEKHIVVSGRQELNDRAVNHNRFFAVRHGEAQHNVENWIASGVETTKNASHLTEKGMRQAENVAGKLKKEKIDLIICSPYIRTKETAKIIAKATKAKVIVDKRIGEIQVGEYNRAMVPAYHAFFNNKLERFTVRPKGKSETLTEVRARMMSFFNDINKKYNNKRIVIVGHGDPLWMLDSALRGLTNEEALASDYYPAHDHHKELMVNNWPVNKDGALDLHRPFVDEVHIACPSCKKPMQRIKEVLDVWLESGAVPYASVNFPYAFTKDGKRPTSEEAKHLFKQLDYPADYIAEGVDQTRGWFYTLLAMSTALGLEPAYKNVICLGLVLDKNGIKMSKSKGNIVDPMMIMKKYGADVLRWYFYTINDPGDPKRFTEDDLAKITRKFILIIYNSFVFWNSYGKHESARKGEPQIKHVLDRWILASLKTLTKEVTAKLDAYQIGEAGRLIEAFADDLSRWYIRRSRDRFQSGDTSEEQDHEAASHTLRLALETISRLLAPFMPFFSDALYQSVGGVQKSVHLADWPTISEENDEDDKALPQKMAKVRTLAAEALALRAELKLKVRQPLASATIKKGTFEEYVDDELMAILKDEINVKKILFADQLPEGKAIILDTEITAELKEEGMVRELVRTIQGLRQDAGYQVGDEIVLMIEASDKLFDVIQRNSIQLKKAVGAGQLEMKKSEKFDIQLESKLDEVPIWIGLRKI